MTLKEKFEEIEDLGRFSDNGYSVWSTEVLDKQTNECEKIADEFAIGFAEWMAINYPNQRKFLLKQGNLMGFYSTKKLLEIYKKEKGL